MNEMGGLSVTSLSLLNLILSNWFRPASGPVYTAYREARLISLEKKMTNSETTCASDLCTVLLSAYDGNTLSHPGGHKISTGKCLVSHTLAVLLASSDTAKTTALEGTQPM